MKIAQVSFHTAAHKVALLANHLAATQNHFLDDLSCDLPHCNCSFKIASLDSNSFFIKSKRLVSKIGLKEYPTTNPQIKRTKNGFQNESDTLTNHVQPST